jgi:hypothetical protein
MPELLIFLLLIATAPVGAGLWHYFGPRTKIPGETPFPVLAARYGIAQTGTRHSAQVRR